MNLIFKVLFILAIFLSGWVMSSLFFVGLFHNEIDAIPEINLKKMGPLSPLTGLFVTSSDELMSPQDRVSEEQIKVYDDRVILLLDDPQWSSFTDTNSMDPFLDDGVNAIEIKPRFPSEIQRGDVVSYSSNEGSIIHRVIDTGYDDQGIYYTLKGDNNPVADSENVRFNQIDGIVVAVVY